jgi:hypothetical protein
VNEHPTNAKQATSPDVLETRIMAVTVPKTEAEWWAHYEIERLRTELAEARRERDRLREAIEQFIYSYPWGPCMPELAGLNAALEGKP